MHCYDCSRLGRSTQALGLCHHCSAAICEEHASVIPEPVMGGHPLVQTVELPKRARLMLCGTCKVALGQPHSRHPEHAAIETQERHAN